MRNEKQNLFIERLDLEKMIKCPKCISFADKIHQEPFSQYTYRCARCGNTHIIDIVGTNIQFNGEQVASTYITF